MVEVINQLGDVDSLEKQNTVVRCIMTKERHAERVKHELAAMWSDYFKPEHVERFTGLHETVWKTMKQASKVKQTVDAAEAQKLQDMVAAVADMFSESKKAA